MAEGAVSTTLAFALKVGSATARVSMTNPRDASKSARAFTKALFCFSVRFIASTNDSGCVIQPGEFVENDDANETGAFVEAGNAE